MLPNNARPYGARIIWKHNYYTNTVFRVPNQNPEIHLNSEFLQFKYIPLCILSCHIPWELGLWDIWVFNAQLQLKAAELDKAANVL